MRLYKGAFLTIVIMTAVMVVFLIGYNFYDSGLGRGIKIRYERAASADNSDVSGTSSVPDVININSATREELMTLDGIGEVRADAIIAYREQHGGFGSVDELTEVSGIGEKMLEKLRGRICVE